TNEAANYKLTIKGTGNIKLITEPVIPFPHGFDEYTPNKEVDARFNGNDMTGSAVIDYTIVPQEVGKVKISAVPFSYFDPSKGEYITLETQSYEVNVGRGANAPVSAEQKQIDTSIKDILHIKTKHESAYNTGSPVFFRLYYWSIYLMAMVLLIIVIAVYRKHMIINADVRRRQLTRATKLAKKRFKSAAAAMHSHQNEKFYEELSKALWGYLSDKLGIPASQLLRDNISSALTQHGADEDTIKNIIAIIDECEMARFTPAHSEEEMSGLYDSAVGVINQMENIKK
ncbi:MAG: BatD family protein, partial [Muribaculaceae bacterium]|nr:BatD family protein [Muribaculaceae bacterium]